MYISFSKKYNSLVITAKTKAEEKQLKELFNKRPYLHFVCKAIVKKKTLILTPSIVDFKPNIKLPKIGNIK